MVGFALDPRTGSCVWFDKFRPKEDEEPCTARTQTEFVKRLHLKDLGKKKDPLLYLTPRSGKSGNCIYVDLRRKIHANPRKST